MDTMDGYSSQLMSANKNSPHCSLAVIPHPVMSLIGNLGTPDYAALYLVQSDVMEEVKERGGYFDGTVGVVDVSDHQQQSQRSRFCKSG
jgi:hypothetical protein